MRRCPFLFIAAGGRVKRIHFGHPFLRIGHLPFTCSALNTSSNALTAFTIVCLVVIDKGILGRQYLAMVQEWVGTGVEGVLLNLLPHRCQAMCNVVELVGYIVIVV